MFVCLCNAIRDTEVKDLARAGVRSAEDAYEALDCEAHCATCTDYIQTIIDTEASNMAASGAA